MGGHRRKGIPGLRTACANGEDCKWGVCVGMCNWDLGATQVRRIRDDLCLVSRSPLWGPPQVPLGLLGPFA